MLATDADFAHEPEIVILLQNTFGTLMGATTKGYQRRLVRLEFREREVKNFGGDGERITETTTEEDALVLLEVPDGAAGFGRSRQPTQIRRDGRGAKNTYVAERKLQDREGLQLADVVKANLAVKPLTNAHIAPDVDGGIAIREDPFLRLEVIHAHRVVPDRTNENVARVAGGLESTAAATKGHVCEHCTGRDANDGKLVRAAVDAEDTVGGQKREGASECSAKACRNFEFLGIRKREKNWVVDTRQNGRKIAGIRRKPENSHILSTN